MVVGLQAGSFFDPKTLRQHIDILRTQLEVERTSFESHWRELSDHILPRRARFFVSDANKGDRRTKAIIDSTPTLAARRGSAGMMGGITSPAREWKRLTTPDPLLAELPEVAQWLEIVNQRMSTVFLRSNLYNSLPIVYKDMLTFGTGAMLIQEDFDSVIRTYPFPIGSYMIANDDKLRVRVFMREFQMTVRQIIQQFGMLTPESPDITWDNISEHVRALWKNSDREQWIEVLHAIIPNPMHDPNKLDSKFKKYLSVYFERGSESGSRSSMRPLGLEEGKFLSMSGFDLFPVLVPRWETTGEDVYGTDCPGMTVLGDIKQLHLGEKRLMQAIEKMVNPPMVGPPAMRTTKTSIISGHMNYATERDGQKGFRPVHEVDPRIQEMEFKQNQLRGRVRSVFFEDLFLQLSTTDRREITAREIEERHEEKMLAIGPVLEQLNQDMLDPLIDLTFDIMDRQGMIPPPPPELAGQQLKVEYISIMAQAQKLVNLGGLERGASFGIQLAQAKPEVLDKLDMDQMIDEYQQIVGMPPSVVVSDEEVAEIRAARAQAQQQQAMLEALQQGASAAKDMSKAEISEDNLLGQLTEASEAGEAAETTVPAT